MSSLLPPRMARRYRGEPNDLSKISQESAQSLAELLDVQMKRSPADAGDIVRTLLLIADMRGLRNLPAECQASCEQLKHQLHGTRQINFASVMRVVRGLGLQLRVEAARDQRHEAGMG